ncbi:DUF1772 domain-containing protein [Amycolatopsis sp. ATCC 39116]|uniref:DUF1772 domain-containing protein n=1 Tax=Amycolatopsis sp. (strain ATCC 39116 / 75iv2) TaxID=385957 RepID=UPI000262558F|nr:DUF1772 domain-containing protein [Amycolatopsis sp. ATCC 39116]
MLEIALLTICGIWTGAVTTIAWERIPVWRRLDLVSRAVDFRRSLKRMDPTMPIVAVVILALGGMYALRHDGAARVLTWLGFAGVALIVVGSIVLLEPINSKFRRLPEGTPPEHAATLFVRWSWLHIVRAGVAIASLALFVAATVS